ncbi:choline O-acetyltransferase-like, partial [Scleropages formosus]
MSEKFGEPGGTGELLQEKLLARRDQKINWVNEFWLDDMYLKNRFALPVNSNPAMVFPKENFRDNNDALRFAAHLVSGMLDYKALLDEYLAGSPLCMEQYYRLFSSYHVLGAEKDTVVIKRRSALSQLEHIIAIWKNQFYILDVVLNVKRLDENDIFIQLEKILAMEQDELERYPFIGLLTSDGRTEWADAWDQLIKDPTNRESICIIERSMCVLCLDSMCVLCLDNRNDIELTDTNRALQMLHGGGKKVYSTLTKASSVQDLPAPKRLHWKCSPDVQALLSSAGKLQRQFTISSHFAITGMAVDNHLLGLREIAQEMNMEKPDIYSDETYFISNQFILTTSQVPITAEMFCCYGLVVPNGYGVCYNPQSDYIIFSVSSFQDGKETCSSGFVKAGGVS